MFKINSFCNFLVFFRRLYPLEFLENHSFSLIFTTWRSFPLCIRNLSITCLHSCTKLIYYNGNSFNFNLLLFLVPDICQPKSESGFLGVVWWPDHYCPVVCDGFSESVTHHRKTMVQLPHTLRNQLSLFS